MSGNARKATLAVLLATMFLVPMMPLGSADFVDGTFDINPVSGNTVTSSSAEYNFTFKVDQSSGDDTLRLEFPSGWDASSAAPQEHNFPGGTFSLDDSDQASFINLTGSGGDFSSGTTYYVNITGIDPPRAAGTYTITAKLFDGGVLNDTITDTISISALNLGIEIDEDHLDEGSDDTVLASGAVTDYYFEVTWNSAFDHSTDSVNITFPSAFDLASSSVTNGDIDDDEAGYNIQSGDAGSNFVVRVEDVKNPTVTENKPYSFKAEIRDNDGDVIADASFVVTIVPTEIVAKHTGSDTVIEEGKDDDDSVTVELATMPANDVTVEIDFGDEITGDKDTLTFTTSTWNTPQTVKLTAVDDNTVEGTTMETVKFTSKSNDANYDGLTDTLDVEIVDNEEGLVLRHTDGKTQVVEGSSAEDSYEVVLSTEPTKDVTVAISPNSLLELDEDELTFTASNWDEPQVVDVKSARTDDNDYQKPQTVTIVHTTTSDDPDYDDLEEELDVIIKDDEPAVLGLTEDQIAEANELVKLTITEEEDGMFLEWDLPTQEDLDDIFESDGDITVEGVQILYSNSPYVIAETFDDGDQEFDDAEYLHLFDDGATTRTKYLVTMFYDEDVGKWTTDDVPDTRDDGYGGTSFEDPLLPWWGWLLIGIGIVILILLILLVVIASQNRNAYDDDDWDDDADSGAVAAAAEPEDDKGKKRKYDIECPVCEHHFSAKGVKPLKTECPNCGAKGTLN